MTSIAASGSAYARLLALTLFCSGLTVPVQAPGQAIASDPPGELRVGEVVRTYLMHVPDRSPAKRGYPVVFAFHGGGGQATRMIELMKLDPLADTDGFIVVYPNGLDRHWNDGRASIKTKSDDVGFVSALLDNVERRYPIDPQRVFAVGVSNGAALTERLGCELSDRLTAIAAISGTMAADLQDSCHPSRPISVLQIAGTADPVMPYAGGAVRQFLGRGEGGNVLSADGTIDLWARLDGCAPPSGTETLAQNGPPDGTAVTRQSLTHCRGSAIVTLLGVQGGGHAWPGSPQILPRIFGRSSNQLDTSRTVIDFFLNSRSM